MSQARQGSAEGRAAETGALARVAGTAAELALELATELAGVGRWMAARGLLPATAGNLSARLSPAGSAPGRVLMTASGGDKGALSAADFLELELDGPLPARASAETELHLLLYRRERAVAAVLHGHSVASTLISLRHAAAGQLSLQGYELIKAFAGVPSHETPVALPIVANGQDMVALAAEVGARLDRPPAGGIWAPGLLLAGHGLYAWGDSVAAARRHLEALEFLLQCELQRHRSDA